MAEPSKQDHALSLRNAEEQFRLMAAVRLACSLKNQPLTVPEVWVFGQERVIGRELKLQSNDAENAAAVLEHTVTYTLCVVAAQAIKDTVPKEQHESDTESGAAYQIVRLLRNAYTHQPFAPVWNFEDKFKNKVFEIKGVIRLDTTSLNGCTVQWQDYGGLLKLFRLSKWIRKGILGDVDADRPPAQNDSQAESAPLIIQLGRMILRRVEEIPSGASVIQVGGKPIKIGEDSDGPYRILPEPAKGGETNESKDRREPEPGGASA